MPATPDPPGESARHAPTGSTTGRSTAPRHDPDDPLRWPLWVKVAVLVQTSLLAAIGGLNTATINPALVLLAREFQISVVRASYQTTVCIALNGIAPWLWIPLAHRYGRRPVWLLTTSIGLVSMLGCAYTQSYAQLLAARVVNGIFPVGFALGATTVVDLFFYHQRGRAMGFFTVTVVNGSHLAPIIGGLLGHYRGWRSIFKFLAVVDAVLLLVAVFCLPETMYVRPNPTAGRGRPAEGEALGVEEGSPPSTESMSAAVLLPFASPSSSSSSSSDSWPASGRWGRYRRRLRFATPNRTYSLRSQRFFRTTIRLFLSPSALGPALYYSSVYGFASIVPAVTVAAIFSKYYHWNTLSIGLSYGGALTIGGVLGEAFAGWICDRVVTVQARRLPAGARLRPEMRLRPIWPGAVLTPAGLLIYGFTLQYHSHPGWPLFGMALSCFGLQIITTTCYTYAVDCHREDSAEVAQLINFIRQCFGMTYAFYVVSLGEEIGYQWTFCIFAVCGGLLAFSPVVALIVAGPHLRAWSRKRFGPDVEPWI